MITEEEILKHELLRDEGILIVKPQKPLESADFSELVKEVDPYLEKNGYLDGLLIYVETFPGWHDFAAFLSILPTVADHFVSAEIKSSGYLLRSSKKTA